MEEAHKTHSPKKFLIFCAFLLVIVITVVAGLLFFTKHTQSSTQSTSKFYGNSNCYTAEEAFHEIGKDTCVIFYVNNATKSQKGNIFLNGNQDYKKGFSVTIYANNLSNFSVSPLAYNNQTIMVSGVIKEYDGHPEIIVDNQSYIKQVQVQ